MTPRLRVLLALLLGVGAFTWWDASRSDAALAGVAEAVPRARPRDAAADNATTAAASPQRVADGAPADATLPRGPRTTLPLGATTPSAAPGPGDLFRPLRSAQAEPPAPSEQADASAARVVGTAHLDGRWVALVEHDGRLHELTPGQSAGGLRVTRISPHAVQVTDLARGTSQRLVLSLK